MKKYVYIGQTFLLIVATITGCATSENGISPKGEAAVFGKVVLPSRIEAKGMWGTSVGIQIIDTKKSKIVLDHHLKPAGGSFCWHFPPGEYAINDVRILGTVGLFGSGAYSLRSYGEFSVPSTQSAIYVGDLTLHKTKDGIEASVADQYENAIENLKKSHPNFTGETTKQLLKLEKKP